MSEVRTKRRWPGHPYGWLFWFIGVMSMAEGLSEIAVRFAEPGPTVWLALEAKSPSWWVVDIFIAALIFHTSFAEGQAFGRSRGVGLVLLFLFATTLFTDGVLEGVGDLVFGVLVIWGDDDDPPVRAARKLWSLVKPPATAPLPVPVPSQ